MSEPRHATVWLVLELLGIRLRPRRQESKSVCRAKGAALNGRWAAPMLRANRLMPAYRITCDRCAIIVDAALEGVKPFPFSLPGVPNEVLR